MRDFPRLIVVFFFFSQYIFTQNSLNDREKVSENESPSSHSIISGLEVHTGSAAGGVITHIWLIIVYKDIWEGNTAASLKINDELFVELKQHFQSLNVMKCIK